MSIIKRDFEIFEYISKLKSLKFSIGNFQSTYLSWYSRNNFNFSFSFEEINRKSEVLLNFCDTNPMDFPSDLNNEIASIICTGRTKRNKIMFIIDPEKYHGSHLQGLVPSSFYLDPFTNQKKIFSITKIFDHKLTERRKFQSPVKFSNKLNAGMQENQISSINDQNNFNSNKIVGPLFVIEKNSKQ